LTDTSDGGPLQGDTYPGQRVTDPEGSADDQQPEPLTTEVEGDPDRARAIAHGAGGQE